MGALSVRALAIIGLISMNASPAGAHEVSAAVEVWVPDHPRLSPDGRRLAAVIDRRVDGRRERVLWVAAADALGSGRVGIPLDPAASAPAWSPDGRQLAVTVRVEDRPQVALVDPRRPTERRLLTDLATGARDPVFSPDGAWIAFASRVYPDCETVRCQERRLGEAESERARIYEQDAPRRWTRWRDGRARHLWAIRARGGPPRDLTPFPARAVAEPMGPEPRWAFVGPESLVYVGEAPEGPGGPRALDTDLYLVRLDQAPVRLTESPGMDFAPVPGAPGRVLYLAAAGADASAAARALDLESLESRPVAPDLGYPVRSVVPFGPGALLVLDREGHRPLVFAPLGGGAVIDRISEGTVSAVHSAGSRIAAVVSRLDAPPELWVLGADGRRLDRTRFNDRWRSSTLKARPLKAPRGDGASVPGFVLSTAPDERRPTLILLHGGPQSAWTDGWHPRWNAQVFAEAGYTVILPNLAGSLGYGPAEAARGNKSWGSAPWDDLRAVMRASEDWPEVGAPVALAGASFGGYLVAWALAKDPRFACGVSHAGVFDPAALWGETDTRWFPEREFGGPPWAPGAVYEKWSPARYAHRIRAPMLLTHGDRDFRVPVEQSLRLFATLKRRGLPVRFLHFPEEGHFIRDPLALETWYGATLDFLHGCLGRAPTASAEDHARTE